MLANIHNAQAETVADAVNNRAERNLIVVTAKQLGIILGGGGRTRRQCEADESARIMSVVGKRVHLLKRLKANSSPENSSTAKDAPSGTALNCCRSLAAPNCSIVSRTKSRRAGEVSPR